jgi:hypothetical protein
LFVWFLSGKKGMEENKETKTLKRKKKEKENLF